MEHVRPAEPGFTDRLARAVVELQPPRDDVIRMTRHCLLDWCAVTVAGMGEAVSRIMVAEYGRGGPAGIPGRKAAAPAEQAALVAGTMAHALDYDDVHNAVGHPGAPIVAAALVTAETEGSDGAALLAAIHAGYEAAIAIGRHAMPSHYDRGFHSTGTLGTFGAAVAAGRLMGLDVAAMTHALGLAATQAAGLKAMFGSMAKPMHAGKAAANGVMSAALARRGFVSGRNAIEGPGGFFATQTSVDGAAMSELGAGIMATRFKRHAACYLTHSTIEAMHNLRNAYGITPDAVRRIDIQVAPGHLSVCCIARPVSGLEVKFSLPHIAAMALHGRNTSTIAAFSDDTARDAELIRTRDLVSISADGPPGAGAMVRLERDDGQILAAVADIDAAETDLDRQEQRLIAKFDSLVIPEIGEEGAASLLAAIQALGEGRPASDLTEKLGALAGR